MYSFLRIGLLCLLTLLFYSPAYAQTADGQTPAQENVARFTHREDTDLLSLHGIDARATECGANAR